MTKRIQLLFYSAKEWAGGSRFSLSPVIQYPVMKKIHNVICNPYLVVYLLTISKPII